MFRACVRWVLWMFYGFRGYGIEALKTPGPVLLLPNHVSWLDWLFLGAFLEKDWKFVTSETTSRTSWIHRKMMVNRLTFPVDIQSPYAVRKMAEYLKQGGRLVLFAEGRISSTGSLMKLFEGTGFLIHQARPKVVTCYLRGAERIPWVKHSGWTQWFPRVEAHFSPAMTPPEIKENGERYDRGDLMVWIWDQIEKQRFEVEFYLGPKHLLDAVGEMARHRPGFGVLEDVNRQVMTYRRLMTGVDVLAAQWRELLVKEGEGERVGVLMPNVNATPVIVLSLWAVGKIPTILNFSTGPATMLICCRLAELKTVLTSRVFVEKGNLDLKPLEDAGIRILFLEEVRTGISGWRKFWAATKAFLKVYPHAPLPPEGRSHHESVAVILFTSGSEGIPKGVELTHGNLLANIRQVLAIVDLSDSDRIFNALPMFHSFGLTIGTLLPLVRGFYAFVYASPLNYRVIPAVVYDRHCTVMVGTNTFLNGYARMAHPYDFRTVRYLFAGAEKLQQSTFDDWARTFGIRVLEGYGVTECSPVLSVNTLMENRVGSTGRLLPGIEYRLEIVEGVAEGGRLLVRGPNIMRGYLNADANAKFQALDGWYDTGDMAHVDERRFVRIIGRLKRFAKISGEMVSLTTVEDALAGAFPQYGPNCQVAVLSRPDEDKGERLIAVTNEVKLGLDEIREVLRAKGLTNLSVPKEIRQIKELPVLGTGKMNYVRLGEWIEEDNGGGAKQG